MALTKIPSELSSTTGIVDNSNATAITIDSNENVNVSNTLQVGDSSITQQYLTSGYIADFQASSGNQTYISIAEPNQTSLGDNGVILGEDLSASYLMQRNNKPLHFGTNNVHNRLSISGAGYVTTPSQPSFRVQTNYTSATTLSLVSPDWSLAAHNIGNHFNLSTNAFTAPVNGNYVFSAHSLIKLVSGSTSYGHIEFLKNGVRTSIAHLPNGDISTYMDISLTEVIYCNANDSITVKAFTSGSNGWYHTANYNSFSGYLLG